MLKDARTSLSTLLKLKTVDLCKVREYFCELIDSVCLFIFIDKGKVFSS